MPNPNPTPFKKTGAAANPNGRPKRDWTWAGLLEEAMEEQDETGVPYKKAIAQKLSKLAKKGDTTAIKMIQDRMDGMATQQTDITSGGEPITFNIDEVIGLSKTPTKTTDSSTDTVQK